MARWIDWPMEDIVMEICWNGDPDNCTVVAREFLPDHECQYCSHYNGDACTKEWNNMDEDYYVPDRDDKEPDDGCEDWDWDEDMDNLLEEPREPKREDYHSDWAFKMAKNAIDNWCLNKWEENMKEKRRDE